MDVFYEWHHFLERAQHEIIMYFDHKSLQYFMIFHVLNQCQFHSTIMSWFCFVVTYYPKHQQGKPNALSHRLYIAPKEGDETYDQQCGVSFKPEHLWFQGLQVALDDKPFLCQIHKDLRKILSLLASKVD